MRRVTAEFVNKRPPSRSILLKWFGIFYFWIAGWKLKGVIPDDPCLLVIAAPHTSNWDGWNLIMTSWISRTNLRWVVKEEFTKGLAGSFVKWTGGLGIKRDKSRNLVDQIATLIKESDDLLLLVAPEGTRKKTDHWRTGFYWMAHKANIPMIAARMDYSIKTISFTGPFYTHGDIEEDIKPIFATYDEVSGLHPERESDKRLKLDDKQKKRPEWWEEATPLGG